MTSWWLGIENQNTIAKNSVTLFVEGKMDAREALNLATNNKCQHIALGKNHSFDPHISYLDHQSKEWLDMIDEICQSWVKWVSLEFDLTLVDWVLETGWCEHPHFIPIICCSIPYIKLFNMNSILKVDDLNTAKNEGTWCHPLPDLIRTTGFVHILNQTRKET